MNRRTASLTLAAYKRKKYAELKSDPELYEKEREKERVRYVKKKEKGQVIPINNMSPREQRLQRKKWREAAKKYREKKKEKEDHFHLPEAVLVKDQSEAVFSHEDTGHPTERKEKDPQNSPADSISKKIRHIRYMEQKKRRGLLLIIKKLKQENKILKYNLRKITNSTLQTTSKTIKKPDKNHIKSTNSKTRVITLIKHFYNQDANSIILPGKKQYITQNKIQKQKRQLILPLKDLHKKFKTEYGMPISYSFFCRHRPFWVVFPKKSLRETCACIIHSNIDLAIECLQKADVIDATNYAQVLGTLCCSQYNDSCLKRECELCKNNTLTFKEFSNDQKLTLYQWVRCKETVKTKKGLKTQVITIKKPMELDPVNAMKILEEQLPKFYKHSYTINTQYNATKNKKDNLMVNEAYIHIDFSENFGLKYGKEVQGLHFGPSRKEVCLHTGIIYTFDFHYSDTGTTCASTLSQCLRHDAPAIWAHLMPMIRLALEKNPFIDTLHFQSDSPSSQYRNKYIFYIISILNKDFPQIKAITWNYSEAGHGKGAPDGIGAVLKRTADNLVKFGQDVSTFSQFVNIVQQNIDNVIIMTVDEDDVSEKEALLPNNLKTVKGTLNIHQVLWKQKSRNLIFRSASCFDCENVCTHNKHLGFLKVHDYSRLENHSEPSPGPSNDLYVTPLAKTRNSQRILTNITNIPQNINVLVSDTPQNIIILSDKKVCFKDK